MSRCFPSLPTKHCPYFPSVVTKSLLSYITYVLMPLISFCTICAFIIHDYSVVLESEAVIDKMASLGSAHYWKASVLIICVFISGILFSVSLKEDVTFEFVTSPGVNQAEMSEALERELGNVEIVQTAVFNEALSPLLALNHTQSIKYVPTSSEGPVKHMGRLKKIESDAKSALLHKNLGITESSTRKENRLQDGVDALSEKNNAESVASGSSRSKNDETVMNMAVKRVHQKQSNGYSSSNGWGQEGEVSVHLTSIDPHKDRLNTHLPVVNYEDDGDKIKRLPNAIIIGAMKSGTSSLKWYLDFHPDIAVANAEIGFFDDDENYEKGIEWYRNRMPESLPGQVVMEKTPSYLKRTNITPPRVYSFDPTVKLIVILSDPVKRVMSHYLHHVKLHERNRGESKGAGTLEENILDENGSIDPHSLIINTSMYYDRIKDWMQYFPREQFHFISGENFTKAPYTELNKLETFLGVSHFFKEEYFVYNATKGFYCFDFETVECLGDNKGRHHPGIDKNLAEQLREFFNPLNQKLYNLLDVSFNWPTKIPPTDDSVVVI